MKAHRKQWPSLEQKLIMAPDGPVDDVARDEVPLPDPNPEVWKPVKLDPSYEFPLDPSIYREPLQPPAPGVKWNNLRNEDGTPQRDRETGNMYMDIDGEKTQYWAGVGRRKTAAAMVKMVRGSGQWVINGKRGEYYLKNNDIYIYKAVEPMDALNVEHDFDVLVKAWGGGVSGQAQAMALAVARAMVDYNQEWKPILRRGGYLTRDQRKKEEKRTGLPKARKGNPYHKR
jgi:small subunit ribosomal protein S9